MKYLLLSLIMFLSIACAQAPENQEYQKFQKTQIPYAPKHYVCYKAGETLTIDGKLDEPAWQKAEWTDEFGDIEGELKPKPKYRTKAKMLWDDENLYVGAWLEEPHVWAKLTKRDAVIFYDNDFEIFIDPDGDTHGYYEYEVNAFATEWDLFLPKPYRDGTCAMDGYDMPGLKSAVEVVGTINDPSDTDECWYVEVKLPWKAFKDCANKETPPEDRDQWRINFSRVQWRMDIVDGDYKKTINPETGRSYPEDNWVWSPQGIINMHAPETWGFLQFSANTVGTETVDFIEPAEDKVKWALRELYYAEREYQLNHGTFTTSLGDLDIESKKIDGYNWPPLIETTRNGFEISLFSTDGSSSWHIIEDGKVWKQSKE